MAAKPQNSNAPSPDAETRQERVERIKRQIREGSYKVNVDSLAESILQSGELDTADSPPDQGEGE